MVTFSILPCGPMEYLTHADYNDFICLFVSLIHYFLFKLLFTNIQKFLRQYRQTIAEVLNQIKNPDLVLSSLYG